MLKEHVIVISVESHVVLSVDLGLLGDRDSVLVEGLHLVSSVVAQQ